MDDAREHHLLGMVRPLRCRAEIDGFRAQLKEQGETLTGALMAALADRERVVG